MVILHVSGLGLSMVTPEYKIKGMEHIIGTHDPSHERMIRTRYPSTAAPHQYREDIRSVFHARVAR